MYQLKLKQPVGFALLELLIVVAIVGILAVIAYPSYLDYIQHTRRTAAQLCLLELAQQMERRYAAELRYRFVDSDSDGVDDLFSAACTTEGGLDSFYIFDGITSGAVNLRAAPTVRQKDRCGTQLINQFGIKTVSGATLTAAQCW